VWYSGSVEEGRSKGLPFLIRAEQKKQRKRDRETEKRVSPLSHSPLSTKEIERKRERKKENHTDQRS
jgi:hypothetical protein